MNQGESETPLYFIDIDPNDDEPVTGLLPRARRAPALTEPRPLTLALLEQAERNVLKAMGRPSLIEITHPDRWEVALGLPPGALRDAARDRVLALATRSIHEATMGLVGAPRAVDFDEMALLPPKKTRARSKAERKARRAKRKQRRQR
jgi:hypothetical protein